jgi:hypothetical protein
MSEKVNVGGLVIDSELLADIQRQCRQRAAELEAAGALRLARVSPPIPAALTEAERFSVAVSEMPASVRRFFEPEEEVPPWRVESAQERAERQQREALGGWCG